jgi:hypothetical protein
VSSLNSKIGDGTAAEAWEGMQLRQRGGEHEDAIGATVLPRLHPSYPVRGLKTQATCMTISPRPTTGCAGVTGIADEGDTEPDPAADPAADGEGGVVSDADHRPLWSVGGPESCKLMTAQVRQRRWVLPCCPKLSSTAVDSDGGRVVPCPPKAAVCRPYT